VPLGEHLRCQSVRAQISRVLSLAISTQTKIKLVEGIREQLRDAGPGPQGLGVTVGTGEKLE
jgi:hypothetical protein